MKALSLVQPWATLVVTGRKRFETRSWPTTYRGTVAIHASKGMPGYAKEAARELGFDPDALPRGVVLGEATIIGCVPTRYAWRGVDAYEIDFGDWTDGRFAWEMTGARLYREPIAARGALGLWEWEP